MPLSTLEMFLKGEARSFKCVLGVQSNIEHAGGPMGLRCSYRLTVTTIITPVGIRHSYELEFCTRHQKKSGGGNSLAVVSTEPGERRQNYDGLDQLTWK